LTARPSFANQKRLSKLSKLAKLDARGGVEALERRLPCSAPERATAQFCQVRPSVAKQTPWQIWQIWHNWTSLAKLGGCGTPAIWPPVTYLTSLLVPHPLADMEI